MSQEKTKEQRGGASRSQEEPRRARKRGRARSSQEEPKGARRSHDEPEQILRSEVRLRDAKSSQEDPGATRTFALSGDVYMERHGNQGKAGVKV